MERVNWCFILGRFSELMFFFVCFGCFWTETRWFHADGNCKEIYNFIKSYQIDFFMLVSNVLLDLGLDESNSTYSLEFYIAISSMMWLGAIFYNIPCEVTMRSVDAQESVAALPSAMFAAHHHESSRCKPKRPVSIGRVDRIEQNWSPSGRVETDTCVK